MRLVRWITGAACACTLAFAGPARAQTAAPVERTVTVPETEVRSGPSPKFYSTSKLHRGDRVRVIEAKEGGWLAIEPPPGSFSWINERLIQRADPNAVVLAPEAPVLIGSDQSNEEPTVQQIKLQRGTLVTILSTAKVYNNNGGWLAIQSPPREVRYIPASAVAPLEQVQVVSSAPPAAPGVSPAGITGPPASGMDPFWLQAEEAERAGNVALARSLYLKLAQQTTDHDLTLRCYNRVHFLDQGYRPASANYQAPAVAQPVTSAYPTAPTYPAPAPSSSYTYARETTPPPIGQAPPVGYTTSAVAVVPQPQAPPAGQWSGPGWLRRAALQVDYKTTYVLESSQGVPRLYVTALPGLNLEQYLNRTVNLYGPMMYRGDLRTNYMTASYVTLLAN